MTNIPDAITSGKTALGIEFGSTRVKAVLIGGDFSVLAEGIHDWENRFENGYWTYSETDILTALQGCFAALKANVKAAYDVTLTTVGAIGISAMMHGYIALDENDRLLVPFRTWRNTTTGESAAALTALFRFNIPERWSVAHLYQAILNHEPHVASIAHLTTLAGYVHFLLTGERIVGIGEASGMFPIDSESKTYDAGMLAQFSALTQDKGIAWKPEALLPTVMTAGACAGRLTSAGAALLDPDGDLQSGIPFCPPEGDAGTGMTATNSVRPRSGNVSAGTSVFAMLVLERPLQGVYPEIDLVTTPSGDPVAMVHCNNCTADIDAWAKVFYAFAQQSGSGISKGEVFDLLYNAALFGDADCGGLLSFNYLSGESITKQPVGVPLFLRTQGSRLTFENFARNLLSGALCTLRCGYDLLRQEQVAVDTFYGHGGFFKAAKAGQTMMANALGLPVTVMQTADVGGPWGMAVLAAFMLHGKEPLPDFLDRCVFQNAKQSTVQPDPTGEAGFDRYYAAFKTALPLEAKAAELFHQS